MPTQPHPPNAPIPFFSSKRERRLWTWTLAVVMAIYSTLGFAGRWVTILRDRDLLDAAFLFGMILVGATIVLLRLRARPSGAEIGVMLGVAVAYLFVVIRMGIPAVERTHLIEYGVVAVFIYEALRERKKQGRTVLMPALLAILTTGLIGALDESIQAFLPNRVFDPFDILFNILAGGMAVAASVVLGWVRRRYA